MPPSHLLSSDFMRRCLCCQHQLKMFQSLCIFLPWPHSTLPPKFLPQQLLVCCKSDQGAELVLTSASLFGLFCWVFFPPEVVCFTVLLQEKIVLAHLREQCDQG